MLPPRLLLIGPPNVPDPLEPPLKPLLPLPPLNPFPSIIDNPTTKTIDKYCFSRISSISHLHNIAMNETNHRIEWLCCIVDSNLKKTIFIILKNRTFLC